MRRLIIPLSVESNVNRLRRIGLPSGFKLDLMESWIAISQSSATRQRGFAVLAMIIELLDCQGKASPSLSKPLSLLVYCAGLPGGDYAWCSSRLVVAWFGITENLWPEFLPKSHLFVV